MEEKKHGGKRRGAGRPKTIGSQRITVTLAPEDVAFLKSISLNISESIRKVIAQARSHE